MGMHYVFMLPYSKSLKILTYVLKVIILVFYAGRMRCLAALARWEELNNLCKEYWTPAEPSARLEMAPMVVL
jgi:hypothetical protein